MIRAHGASKKISNDGFLFEKINFTLNKGQLLFLSGKSGSGKSVFLRSLVLLTPLDEGYITYKEDKDFDILAYRSKVHYLHQDFYPTQTTGLEILTEAFNLNIYKDKKHIDPKIFLNEFNLGESFLKKKAPLLSGGERQILHLIRSLCLFPDALLLDEPTSAMDPATKRIAEGLISKFVHNGGAVVWITHEAPPLIGANYLFPQMEKIK